MSCCSKTTYMRRCCTLVEMNLLIFELEPIIVVLWAMIDFEVVLILGRLGQYSHMGVAAASPRFNVFIVGWQSYF